jgi:hypothetical protein
MADSWCGFARCCGACVLLEDGRDNLTCVPEAKYALWEKFLRRSIAGVSRFSSIHARDKAWCGRQVRVFRRVDKIFDWILASGLRRMRDTVILDGLRCDGCYHGGCQADCPILWKSMVASCFDEAETGNHAVTGSSGGLDLGQFTMRIDAGFERDSFVS